MKIKVIILNFILFILAILLAWSILEGMANIYLQVSSYDKVTGRWEFRSSCPLPYKNAPYFNGRFIRESIKCVTLHPSISTEYLPPVPGDFSGRYFNVKDGLRKTAYQPDKFSNKVLLFGGSTIFCQEVPDRYTIPSYLQKFINLNAKSYLVENHGVVGDNVSAQTIRLLHTPVSPGDIIIFYDGVNDVQNPIYGKMFAGGFKQGSEGWYMAHGLKKLNFVQKAMFPFAIKFQKRSSIARIILKLIEYQPLFTIADKDAPGKGFSEIESAYLFNLEKAHEYVKKNGGSFYHFLQPNIFMFSRHTPYEKEIINNELKLLPGLDLAFYRGYPRLREAISSAAKTGMVSFDLSGLLRERKKGVEYFLDPIHVNHLANEIIAQRIYNCIFNANRLAR